VKVRLCIGSDNDTVAMPRRMMAVLQCVVAVRLRDFRILLCTNPDIGTSRLTMSPSGIEHVGKYTNDSHVLVFE